MQFTIGDRIVGYDHPPYIIAEACNNFNNDVAAALDLCNQAKDVGCDAIKFQMRLQKDRLRPWEHADIANHCREIGIQWLCSAFDEKGFANVEAIGVPAHKIPSGEFTNHDLIRKVIGYDKPMMLSTGMCEWTDVRETSGVMWRVGRHIPYALLQCTSIYPCPYERVQLQQIGALMALQGGSHLPVGLSDHTPTIWTAIGAVALGARIIEKHITKNVRAKGPDHACSLTPTRFAQLVEGCRAVWEARGSNKEIFPEELEKAKQHKYGMRE
jgi:N-acetylneuraminate synthase